MEASNKERQGVYASPPFWLLTRPLTVLPLSIVCVCVVFICKFCSFFLFICFIYYIHVAVYTSVDLIYVVSCLCVCLFFSPPDMLFIVTACICSDFLFLFFILLFYLPFFIHTCIVFQPCTLVSIPFSFIFSLHFFIVSFSSPLFIQFLSDLYFLPQ